MITSGTPMTSETSKCLELAMLTQEGFIFCQTLIVPGSMISIVYDLVWFKTTALQVQKKHINLQNVTTGFHGCHDEIDVHHDTSTLQTSPQIDRTMTYIYILYTYYAHMTYVFPVIHCILHKVKDPVILIPLFQFRFGRWVAGGVGPLRIAGIKFWSSTVGGNCWV